MRNIVNKRRASIIVLAVPLFLAFASAALAKPMVNDTAPSASKAEVCSVDPRVVGYDHELCGDDIVELTAAISGRGTERDAASTAGGAGRNWTLAAGGAAAILAAAGGLVLFKRETTAVAQ